MKSHEIIQSHMYLIEDDIVPDSLKKEISQRGHYSYLYVEIKNVVLDSSTARVLPVTTNENIEFTIITIEELEVEKNVGGTDRNRYLQRQIQQAMRCLAIFCCTLFEPNEDAFETPKDW